MSASTATTKRPPTGDFYQQRMKAWQPIMTPRWVISTFLIIGITFVAIGYILLQASNGVVELKIQYDGEGTELKSCMISNENPESNCTLNLTATSDMQPPIYVYYELHNFYQNHRRYVKSRSDKQLMGEIVSDTDLESSCAPLLVNSDNNKPLNPCGLIANSMFNDVFTAQDPEQKLNERGIAWESDISSKFKNPTEYGAVGTQWLYETFPNVISKDKSDDEKSASFNGGGVQNEHFIVWMRTAALSTFRKLYGKIEVEVKKDDVISFDVDARFRVDEFKGKKFLVLSTTSWLGGKNPFLGYSYLTVGIVCLVLAAVFITKQVVAPRQLGDTSYLVWKNK